MSNIYQIKKRKSIKWILDHGHATIHGAKTSRPTAAVHAGTPVTPESRVSPSVTEEGGILLSLPPPTSHILQSQDSLDTWRQRAPLSGFQKVFKGPKRLPPEIRGPKSDGDWVQEV